MINKDLLIDLYIKKRKSVHEISKFCGYSPGKINYWMRRFDLKKRSISEAVYVKSNPNGDPFIFKKPTNLELSELFGFGLGLYWGEGTKADKNSVRLGNSDPGIINKFLDFLTKIFGVDRADFRFGLQIFNDISAQEAMDFWSECVRINRRQFYKPTVSPSVSVGTYKKRAKYGVLTVYYHNKKLRDLLVSLLPM